MGENSILAYFFRPAVTRGETLTRGGFSGGKFYTGGGGSLCYNTGTLLQTTLTLYHLSYFGSYETLVKCYRWTGNVYMYMYSAGTNVKT